VAGYLCSQISWISSTSTHFPLQSRPPSMTTSRSFALSASTCSPYRQIIYLQTLTKIPSIPVCFFYLVTTCQRLSFVFTISGALQVCVCMTRVGYCRHRSVPLLPGRRARFTDWRRWKMQLQKRNRGDLKQAERRADDRWQRMRSASRLIIEKRSWTARQWWRSDETRGCSCCSCQHLSLSRVVSAHS